MTQKAQVDPRVALQRRRQQLAGFIVATVGDQVHGHGTCQHHVQVHFIGRHLLKQLEPQAATGLSMIRGAQLQAMQHAGHVGVFGAGHPLQALGNLHGIFHPWGTCQ
ncbi:hypothetical protein D9M71_730260 [compost metagenome]